MKIKLNVKPQWKAERGHMEHRSGAGVHQDRRNRRERTRATAAKKHIMEFFH